MDKFFVLTITNTLKPIWFYYTAGEYTLDLPLQTAAVRRGNAPTYPAATPARCTMYMPSLVPEGHDFKRSKLCAVCCRGYTWFLSLAQELCFQIPCRIFLNWYSLPRTHTPSNSLSPIRTETRMRRYTRFAVKHVMFYGELTNSRFA